MKILIADKISEAGIESLRIVGMKVVFDADLDGDTLVTAIAEHQPNVLVVRSTKVDNNMLSAASTLSLVIRAGAGVNTIDVDGASKLGIFVANCPGKNAVAVAELTMGLILALDRHIPDGVSDLREGKWNKKKYSKAQGLKGRTLGLIGLGNIAREVVKRANAFEMPIVAWSRSLTDEKAKALGVTRLNSPTDVAAKADIVSVHVAMTNATRGLCDKAFFAAMKDGAYFINTSRAEVIDESALVQAINNRGILAGLDLFASEPAEKACDWQSELSVHPSVVGTHHIGASTEQAQRAIADEALRIVKTYAYDGVVLNCVNLITESDAACILSVRHLNQVGVLAGLLSSIQEEGINVLEMDNSLFAGEEAAIAKIALSKPPSKDCMDNIISENNAIISLSLLESSSE